MVSEIQWACAVLLSAITAAAPLDVSRDGVIENALGPAPIAVIVNSSNPMSTVGIEELRRLFLGQAHINSAHVDNSVKILEIDGRRPTDPQYPVR